MYTIYCNNIEIYNPQKENTALISANLNLESNTAGSATLEVPFSYNYYSLMNDKTAIFTIIEDGEILFKGRVYEIKKDWNNNLNITLEGLLSVLADVIQKPFNYPEDYRTEDYYNAENDVEYFLNKIIIERYNSVCKDAFDEFTVPFNLVTLTVGNVTVTDPNNEIYRSSEDYSDLWTLTKEKLLDSNLEGYVTIRYGSDGKNYIDYLSEFTEKNTQQIVYGENLLELTDDEISTDVVSAVLPIGKDGLLLPMYNGIGSTGYKSGQIVSDDKDLFFHNQMIVSKKALQKYGWRSKVEKFDAITEQENLLQRAITYMQNDGIKLKDTLEISAVDLHLTDSQINSLRINKKVDVISTPHKINEPYDLTKLEIDMLEPQNTKITVTKTKSIF